MIVKSEEHNLGECLRSVTDLVDEIVVADTGSTDKTKEIARQFGAKVIDFPWIDHFAAARNAALQHATGHWRFWMDADDRLDEDNRAKLRALFAQLPDGQILGYQMKCSCLPGPDGARRRWSITFVGFRAIRRSGGSTASTNRSWACTRRERALREVLAIDPNHTEARNNLTELLRMEADEISRTPSLFSRRQSACACLGESMAT